MNDLATDSVPVPLAVTQTSSATQVRAMVDNTLPNLQAAEGSSSRAEPSATGAPPMSTHGADPDHGASVRLEVSPVISRQRSSAEYLTIPVWLVIG